MKLYDSPSLGHVSVAHEGSDTRAIEAPNVLSDSSSGDRYRPIMTLGSGGMADVELAIQANPSSVSKLVVLKRPRSEFSSDASKVAMFLAEANLATRLSHPNVAHTYEDRNDRHGPCLVMEYLHGQSYATVLSRLTATPSDFALCIQILIATLSGLEYAHELRDFNGDLLMIVHRDVSPANIFITYNGQIKLLDFGIAKVLGSVNTTNPGEVKGKIGYMAPEQLEGIAIDARTDLYSIGVMLWEAAAGNRRWAGHSSDSIIRALVMREPPTPPGAAARGLPARVDEICLRALAPDPNERFNSAAEFREELEAILAELGCAFSPRLVGQHVRELFEEEASEREACIESILRELAITGEREYTAPDTDDSEDAIQTLEKVHTRRISPEERGLAISNTAFEVRVPEPPEDARRVIDSSKRKPVQARNWFQILSAAKPFIVALVGTAAAISAIVATGHDTQPVSSPVHQSALAANIVLSASTPPTPQSPPVSPPAQPESTATQSPPVSSPPARAESTAQVAPTGSEPAMKDASVSVAWNDLPRDLPKIQQPTPNTRRALPVRRVDPAVQASKRPSKKAMQTKSLDLDRSNPWRN